MHKFLFYTKFIICLYMFRALCIITPTGVMIPDAVEYNFDLLMISTQCSKHLQA